MVGVRDSERMADTPRKCPHGGRAAKKKRTIYANAVDMPAAGGRREGVPVAGYVGGEEPSYKEIADMLYGGRCCLSATIRRRTPALRCRWEIYSAALAARWRNAVRGRELPRDSMSPATRDVAAESAEAYAHDAVACCLRRSRQRNATARHVAEAREVIRSQPPSHATPRKLVEIYGAITEIRAACRRLMFITRHMAARHVICCCHASTQRGE